MTLPNFSFRLQTVKTMLTEPTINDVIALYYDTQPYRSDLAKHMLTIEDGIEVITLYYDIHYNQFTDEDGMEIDFIFDYITPDELSLFRHNQETMQVWCHGRQDVVVELVYPEGCCICANFDCDNNPYFEGYPEEDIL